MRCYEEVIDFIASGPSPHAVVDFRLSEQADRRAASLVEQEKAGALSADEKSELDHYLQIEHLMRLAKARAHHYLANA